GYRSEKSLLSLATPGPHTSSKWSPLAKWDMIVGMDRDRRRPPDDQYDEGDSYNDEEYPLDPDGRGYAVYREEPDVPGVPRRRRRPTELPPAEYEPLPGQRPRSARRPYPGQRQPQRPQRRRRRRWSQLLM